MSHLNVNPFIFGLLHHGEALSLKITCSARAGTLITLLSSPSQRLAYAITPETEHHLVDNGEVRQFTVSVIL